MSSLTPWPDFEPEDRWAVDEFEDQLKRSLRTPKELEERASELRAEAVATDIEGFRRACLRMAERYEAAAVARLARS
jgi:hypothetical protein